MADLPFRSIPLFAGISPEDMEAISRIAQPRSFPRGTVIFRQGDPGDGLYLIEEGRVKVFLADEEEEEEEVIVDLLGPGDYFGEMALIDAEPRSSGVATLQDTEVHLIGKSDFRRLLQGSNELAQSLLQGLSERLRNANRMIEALATLDVHGRVARTLLQYAETRDGQVVVAEPLTQQDIAHMVGASREMVNRVLQDLTRRGMIRREGRTLFLDGFPTPAR